MKKIESIRKEIESRLNTNLKQIEKYDERIQRDFIQAFNVGYISDKYQLRVENQYLREFIDIIDQSSDPEEGLELLEKFIKYTTENILKMRVRGDRPKDELIRLAMSESVMFVRDLLKYGKDI